MNKVLHKVSKNIKVITGYPFNSNLFNVDGRGVPLVRIRDLLSKTPEVSFDGPVDSQYLVNQGDVLIGMDGEFNLAIWKGCRAALNQRVMLLKELPNSEINLKYFSYFLVGFLKDIENKTPQTTVKHLSHLSIANSELLLPSYQQQQKIAEILTVLDEQIEVTGALIEKKKDIKRGLVQDLIYTKKHDRPLEKAADILDNLRIPVNDEERQRRGGDVPYYGANGLQGFIDKSIFNEPLILIAEDGGNFEQFATRPIAYRISGPSWVNNHAHILRAKNYNQDYLFYALEHMNILNLISGGTRAKLNQGELKKIKVPSADIEEQERVSELINLIVNEINSLSSLVNKLIVKKQGLMQDLLSGRVRVN
jgi:type I restriction enzyme S subunit